MRQTTKIWVVPLDGGLDQVKLVHNLSSGRKYLYINDVFAQSYAKDGAQEIYLFNIGKHVGQITTEKDLINGHLYSLNIDGTIIQENAAFPSPPEPDIKMPELDLPDEVKKCPYCESFISAKAKKCCFCGEWIETPRASLLPKMTPQKKVVPQVQLVSEPMRKESAFFAILTFILYLFLFPAGLFFNLIGLLTGPNRGCFRQLFFVFIILPVMVIIFLVSVMGLSIATIFDKFGSLLSPISFYIN